METLGILNQNIRGNSSYGKSNLRPLSKYKDAFLMNTKKDKLKENRDLGGPSTANITTPSLSHLTVYGNSGRDLPGGSKNGFNESGISNFNKDQWSMNPSSQQINLLAPCERVEAAKNRGRINSALKTQQSSLAGKNNWSTAAEKSKIIKLRRDSGETSESTLRTFGRIGKNDSKIGPESGMNQKLLETRFNKRFLKNIDQKKKFRTDNQDRNKNNLFKCESSGFIKPGNDLGKQKVEINSIMQLNNDISAQSKKYGHNQFKTQNLRPRVGKNGAQGRSEVSIDGNSRSRANSRDSSVSIGARDQKLKLMRHATDNPVPKPQIPNPNNFDEFYGENFEKFYKDSSELSINKVDLSKKPKKSTTKRSATRDFTSYGCSQKDNTSL